MEPPKPPPLQRVVTDSGAQPTRLFLRCAGNVVVDGDGATVAGPGCVNTFTWYNILDAVRLSEYTGLSRVVLDIEVRGIGRLRVSRCVVRGIRRGASQVLHETHFAEELFSPVRIPIDLGDGGLIWFEMRSPLEESESTSGGPPARISGADPRFEAPPNAAFRAAAFRPVDPPYVCYPRLSFIVCTYRREAQLERLVATLRRWVDERAPRRTGAHGSDGESRCPGVRVVVVDNGDSLETRTEGPICVVKNPNTGGSGGFMRGLQETLARAKGTTHVMFTDDDIGISPVSLDRIESLVTYAAPRYRHAAVSGAMLIAERPTMLHEFGASWGGIRHHSRCSGVDVGTWRGVRKALTFVRLHRPYASFRAAVFPLPVGDAAPTSTDTLFQRWDDVDFSLSNVRSVMTLNGVSVHHPGFTEPQDPVVTRYYGLFNLFLVNERHIRAARVRNASAFLERVAYDRLRCRPSIYTICAHLAAADYLRRRHGERFDPVDHRSRTTARCSRLYASRGARFSVVRFLFGGVELGLSLLLGGRRVARTGRSVFGYDRVAPSV